MNTDKLEDKINKEKETFKKLILLQVKISKLSSIKEIQDSIKGLLSPLNNYHKQNNNSYTTQQLVIDNIYTVDVLIKELQNYCKKYKVNKSDVQICLADDTSGQSPYEVALELSCSVEKTLDEYKKDIIKLISEKIKKCNISLSNYIDKIKKEETKY